MLIDWLVIHKHIEQSLPAVHKYRFMEQGHAQITAITLVQDWSFCSDWETAIINAPHSVLRVLYDENDHRYFDEKGDYLNKNGATAARMYYQLTWNVMMYSGCYLNKHRQRKRIYER